MTPLSIHIPGGVHALSALVLACTLDQVHAENLPPRLVGPVAYPGDLQSVDTQALLSEATRYANAEGVSRDYEKAVSLYCHAARGGNADAQYALGWMYANGRGVARDERTAAYLFTLAAELGHQQARHMLRHVSQDSGESVPLPDCLLPEKPEPVARAYAFDDSALSGRQKAIFELVNNLAPRYAVDPALVMTIISVESSFNAQAKSAKNAQGLMQLIPETAQRFQVKDSFDPEQNIRGGLAYLQWLLAFFKGNIVLVAAAYNAGERAVEKYRGVPPYPETRDYVRKVTSKYEKSIHPYQAEIVEASPIMVKVGSNRGIKGKR